MKLLWHVSLRFTVPHPIPHVHRPSHARTHHDRVFQHPSQPIAPVACSLGRHLSPLARPCLGYDLNALLLPLRALVLRPVHFGPGARTRATEGAPCPVCVLGMAS